MMNSVQSDRAPLLDTQVVLISGAARGQGRAHAVRCAQEGADLICFDICGPVASAPYEMPTEADLRETVRLAQLAGARVVSGVADVRKAEEIQAVLDQGLQEFGRVDAVLANAGITLRGRLAWQLSDETFQEVIDINLLGAWKTAKIAIPAILAAGSGGAIIFTASGMAMKATQYIAPYVASKHALIGLMRTMAKELAPLDVRVNCVLPGNTNTPMFRNRATRRLFVPEQSEPTDELFLERAAAGNPMKIPYVEAEDISEAVVWLLSDAARYVTGVSLPVDGGSSIP
jgi:SDR family mycofactocin-dependent oxidoreductase